MVMERGGKLALNASFLLPRDDKEMGLNMDMFTNLQDIQMCKDILNII